MFFASRIYDLLTDIFVYSEKVKKSPAFGVVENDWQRPKEISETPITANVTRQVNVKKTEEEANEDEQKRLKRAAPKEEVDLEPALWNDGSWV